MKTGLQLITEERERQISAEGYSHAHDDRHDRSELSHAAGCYLLAEGPHDGMPSVWPWGAEWWKPKDRLKNLVRAGALFLAEAQRLERAGESAGAELATENVEEAADEIDRLLQVDPNTQTTPTTHQ